MMILRTWLEWLRRNINQSLYPQETHHISPKRTSYGVSIVKNLDKFDRVITASHCTYDVIYNISQAWW